MKARYRIETDGTPYGTFIYDPDGNLLKGVQGMTWKVNFDGPATVTLDVLAEVEPLSPSSD